MAGTATLSSPTTVPTLSRLRMHALRGGYLMIGVGLVLVKWPMLPSAQTLPLFEGVTLCLLAAMSLLAFLGFVQPLKLLPLLVFETGWKLLWLGLVGVPHLVAGDLDSATAEVLTNCSLVVVVLAVVPWRYVWHTYVRTTPPAWR